MGKFTPTGVERAGEISSGVLNGVANSPWVGCRGRTNAAIVSAFTGSARLEFSFDGGTTAIPVTLADGTVRSFTGRDRLVFDEPESGVLYRFACTALTAGTISWRFSR